MAGINRSLHVRAGLWCQEGSCSSAAELGIAGEALCFVGVRTFPRLWLLRGGGLSAAAADGDRCWWDDGAGSSLCLWDWLGA